jgi:hypothetical protein
MSRAIFQEGKFELMGKSQGSLITGAVGLQSTGLPLHNYTMAQKHLHSRTDFILSLSYHSLSSKLKHSLFEILWLKLQRNSPHLT